MKANVAVIGKSTQRQRKTKHKTNDSCTRDLYASKYFQEMLEFDKAPLLPSPKLTKDDPTCDPMDPLLCDPAYSATALALHTDNRNHLDKVGDFALKFKQRSHDRKVMDDQHAALANTMVAHMTTLFVLAGYGPHAWGLQLPGLQQPGTFSDCFFKEPGTVQYFPSSIDHNTLTGSGGCKKEVIFFHFPFVAATQAGFDVLNTRLGRTGYCRVVPSVPQILYGDEKSQAFFDDVRRAGVAGTRLMPTPLEIFVWGTPEQIDPRTRQRRGTRGPTTRQRRGTQHDGRGIELGTEKAAPPRVCAVGSRVPPPPTMQRRVPHLAHLGLTACPSLSDAALIYEWGPTAVTIDRARDEYNAMVCTIYHDLHPSTMTNMTGPLHIKPINWPELYACRICETNLLVRQNILCATFTLVSDSGLPLLRIPRICIPGRL